MALGCSAMTRCEEYRMNGFDDEYPRVNGVQKESDKYEPADRGGVYAERDSLFQKGSYGVRERKSVIIAIF